MARLIISKFDYPRSATGRKSFTRNLMGGVLGTRAVHSDFRRSGNWRQAALSYVIFFFITLGLALLFLNLVIPGVLEFVWTWVMLFVLLHLFGWILRTAIYHVLCKVAGGVASVKDALIASAFIYPLSTGILATFCLVAIFVRLEWFAALLVPIFLVVVAFLWRALVIIRGASALYNIPTRNAAIMLAILLTFLGLVALGVYALASGYISTVMLQ